MLIFKCGLLNYIACWTLIKEIGNKPERVCPVIVRLRKRSKQVVASFPLIRLSTITYEFVPLVQLYQTNYSNFDQFSFVSLKDHWNGVCVIQAPVINQWKLKYNILCKRSSRCPIWSTIYWISLEFPLLLLFLSNEPIWLSNLIKIRTAKL